MTGAFIIRAQFTIALIVWAIPAHSESDTSGNFSLADDGSISNWTIESSGNQFQVVAPGEHQFRLDFSAKAIPPSAFGKWRRVKMGIDRAQTFRATDKDETIEIRRVIQSKAEDKIWQAISVKNLTEDPLTGFRLGLELGGSLIGQRRGPRSLADYVYGYHRVDAALGAGNWQPPSPGLQVSLLAITSRHASLVLRSDNLAELESIQAPDAGTPSQFDPNSWQIVLGKGTLDPGETMTVRLEIAAFPTMTEIMDGAGLYDLIYADLWGPLGALCRWVEGLLRWLSDVVGNLGLAVILFAAATRLVTLPASIWATRRQQEYKVRFDRAKPQMDKARKDYKGAEQSERILAIYKENKITPFSGLKGSVGLLAQIPFLLAVFNVTTRSSIFAHENFLWISNLALPDGAFALPIIVPILGGSINALPLTLGALNIASSTRDQETNSASKMVPIIISLLIVTVFYSFSAALVLYWLTINLLQAGEKHILRRLSPYSEPRK